MRVLVTGGSGFLGSHVADNLSDRGHEVVVFDRVPSRWIRPDQEMIVGDVLDRDAVSRAAAGCKAVYHMAALADIEESMASPREAITVNIMGTLGVLEAAVAVRVERFVFSSSIYVYSNKGSFYRTSKQACENLAYDFEEAYGLPFTILRFGSLYGPRAGSTNWMRRMVKQALSRQRIVYDGTGQEIREYIHILDAAAAACDVLAPEFENEIVHVTGQERITTREVIEMTVEILGGGISAEFSGKSWSGHYVQTPYSYMPKLGRKLVPQTHIDLGLGLLDYCEKLSQEADKSAADAEETSYQPSDSGVGRTP